MEKVRIADEALKGKERRIMGGVFLLSFVFGRRGGKSCFGRKFMLILLFAFVPYCGKTLYICLGGWVSLYVCDI